MITIRNLSLSFGAQKLYDGISLTINADQRIGLVGRNGTGKSTLLKIIMDATHGSNAAISITKTAKIGYLPQDVVLASPLSIIDETCKAFEQISILQDRIADIERNIGHTESPDLLENYAHAQAELQHLNPDGARAQAKEVLMGLGFTQEQLNQTVNTLSVGWKMRIVLAKLLLQKADFYLFDEPTNHLDIVAKDWFLRFLQKASFGFIMVCHERYFLNKLTDYTLELELGKAKLYTGNYAIYEQQKEADRQRLETMYNEQQREIRRKEETIARFRAKANKAAMAQSMMKALNRIEVIELPPSPKNVHFSFPPIKPSGSVVLHVKNLGFSFSNKHVFDSVNFNVDRHQKVAIVAANGVGKTTLLNVLNGIYKPTTGSVTYGHNVNRALFEQDQAASLNLERTILENIEDAHPKLPLQKIRTFLGCFLFSNDDISKKVKVLSGGEKNKVGMVKVLLADANLLFLDEPTNHLDMPSKDMLLKALQTYEGTIIFVSHDHDFINHLATHIIELMPHGAIVYQGNYDDYLMQKQARAASAEIKTQQQPTAKENAAKAPALSSKDLYELNKKIKTLEKKIEKLEAEIPQTELAFADLTYGTEPYKNLEIKLRTLKETLNAAFLEWEALQKNLSNQ